MEAGARCLRAGTKTGIKPSNPDLHVWVGVEVLAALNLLPAAVLPHHGLVARGKAEAAWTASNASQQYAMSNDLAQEGGHRSGYRHTVLCLQGR